MDTSQAARDQPESLPARIAAMRSQGEWRADPVRFRYLEALSQRMAAQQDPVRRLLERKLQAGLAEYAQRVAQTAPVRPPATPSRSAATCAPLADLNAHIRRVSTERDGPAEPGEERDPHELPSARRFRRAWESGRTLDEVEQAIARTPANAGPLNSHALVLRSLALMRDLSPDYLRRFLVHAETLHWLEQARDQYPREQAKAGRPARRARRKK